jgi:flagellar hook assembly protein FlgD
VVQISVEPSVSLSMSTDTIDPAQGETVAVRTVIGGDTRVSVVIEDRFGAVVKTLVPLGQRAGGSYDDVWAGEDDNGVQVPEGDYYAVLLYEIGGVINRLDLRETTGGSQFNPPRSRLPSVFAPFAANPLLISFTLSRAAEVTAFMGRFNANTRLVTFLERRPLGRGGHSLVWNGENGEGQLIHPPAGDRFLFGIFGFTLANNAVYVRSGAHVSGLSVAPFYFDPSGHVDDLGAPERSTLGFSLSKAADVELLIADAESGGVLDRILYPGLPAGSNVIEWDGKTSDGVFVAPGRYRLGVTAIDASGFRSITLYALQRVYY